MDMPASPERVWSMIKRVMLVRRRGGMYEFNFHQPETVRGSDKLYSESEDPMYLAGGIH